MKKSTNPSPDSFQAWAERFKKEESEKLKNMTLSQKISYILTYYYVQIIAALVIIGIVVFLIVQLSKGGEEYDLFACFANTTTELSEGSEFYKEYKNESELSSIRFESSLYCHPAESSYTTYYNELITWLDSAQLDVLIMNAEDIAAVGYGGRLQDLEESEYADVFAEYADRFVYCTPYDEDYGKDQVAVGIDISDCILTGRYGAYEDDCVISFAALSENTDEAVAFFLWLMETE